MRSKSGPMGFTSPGQLVLVSLLLAVLPVRRMDAAPKKNQPQFEDLTWEFESNVEDLPGWVAEPGCNGNEFERRRCEKIVKSIPRARVNATVHLLGVPAEVDGDYDFDKQAFLIKIPGVLAGSRSRGYVTMGRPSRLDGDDPVVKAFLHRLRVPEADGQAWRRQNARNVEAEMVAKMTSDWALKPRGESGDELVGGQGVKILGWRLYNKLTGAILASIPPSRGTAARLPRRYKSRDPADRARISFSEVPAPAMLFMGHQTGIDSNVSKESMRQRYLVAPGFFTFQVHDGKRFRPPFYAELAKGDVLEIAFSSDATEEPSVKRRRTGGAVDLITKATTASGNCGALKFMGIPAGGTAVVADWNGFSPIPGNKDTAWLPPGFRDVGVLKKAAIVYSVRIEIKKDTLVQVDFRGKFSNSAATEEQTFDSKAQCP